MAQDTAMSAQEACADGDLAVCLQLGTLFESGDVIERDLEQARELYRLACEGGELMGCARLGVLFEEGLGVEPDPILARGWFLVACEGSVLLACERLDDPESLASDGADARPGEETTFERVGYVVASDGETGLPGAIVQLSELGIREFTDEEGVVILRDVPAGEHRISVERAGFEDIVGILEVPSDRPFRVILETMEEVEPAAPATLLGLVTDEDGRGLSGVDAYAVGRGEVRAVTNADGRFILENIEPGLLELRIARIGYVPRTAFVIAHPASRVEIEAILQIDPIPLEPVNVMVEADVSGYLRRVGFAERRDRGVGRQLTREQIDATFAERTSVVFQRLPGFRVLDLNRGRIPRKEAVVSPRCPTMPWSGGDHVVNLYLDGSRLADPDINQIDLDQIEAIEVYHGTETPRQYRGADNPCGVVLFWTGR